MTSAERIAVEPAVMIWARESAGLDLDQAARKLSVSRSSLEGWEAGDKPPTIKQLRKAAKAYRRPLAVLLLSSPPNDFSPLRDFRRTGATEPMRSPELMTEVKRALTQREVFLELSEVSPASLAASDQIPAIGEDVSSEAAGILLRQALNLDSIPQATWSRPSEALNRCIGAVERLGVIVMQTHGIEVEELRGFSISELPYQVIALNGKDCPRARLFTLFHELAHLALRADHLPDLHEEETRHRTSDDETEHYCNSVAASILMPANAFLTEPLVAQSDGSKDWSLDELSQLTAGFGASSEAVLLRLVASKRPPGKLTGQGEQSLKMCTPRPEVVCVSGNGSPRVGRPTTY